MGKQSYIGGGTLIYVSTRGTGINRYNVKSDHPRDDMLLRFRTLCERLVLAQAYDQKPKEDMFSEWVFLARNRKGSSSIHLLPLARLKTLLRQQDNADVGSDLQTDPEMREYLLVHLEGHDRSIKNRCALVSLLDADPVIFCGLKTLEADLNRAGWTTEWEAKTQLATRR